MLTEKAPTDYHFQGSPLNNVSTIWKEYWYIRTLFILICRLVDDGTMLETAQIEHANATIRSAANKNVDTVGTKSDIEDLFIMGNQLRLRCKCRDIPDGTGRVNAGCNDQTRGDGVPVKGGNRGSVLWGFRIRKQGQW